MSRYITYLASEIEANPTKIDELRKELPVDIEIVDPSTMTREQRRAFRKEIKRLKSDVSPQHRPLTHVRRLGDGRRVIFTFTRDEKDRRNVLIILGGLSVVILILLFAYLVTARLFNPLKPIQAGVQRIGRGELDDSIPIRRINDLVQIFSCCLPLISSCQGHALLH